MPTTIEALIIVALVLAPGYVFAKVAGDVIAFAREPGDLRFLLPTITCGTAVHIVMSPWTIRIIDHYRADRLTSHTVQLVVWGTCLIFLVPVALGAGFGRISNIPWIDRQLDKIGLGYIDRMPSAWDYMVRLEQPGFIRVHLKDGGLIGGIFYNRSFASTTPERADLYLEEAWQLDDAGNFVRPLADTQGIWIPHDTMQYVEFFTEGDADGRQDKHELGSEYPEQADTTSGQRQAGGPAEGHPATEPQPTTADPARE